MSAADQRYASSLAIVKLLAGRDFDWLGRSGGGAGGPIHLGRCGFTAATGACESSHQQALLSAAVVEPEGAAHVLQAIP